MCHEISYGYFVFDDGSKTNVYLLIVFYTHETYYIFGSMFIIIYLVVTEYDFWKLQNFHILSINNLDTVCRPDYCT